MHVILRLGYVITGLLLMGCKKDNPGISAANLRTYYVSNEGSDINIGTSPAYPWKSIAKVNNHKFLPGDKVLFNGGETFNGNLVIAGGGNSTKAVTITSYGTGKAIINAGTGSGLTIHNAADVVINNLTIKGGWNAEQQSGNSGTGIEFYNQLTGAVKLGAISISGCEVSGFMNGGISIKSYPSDKSQSGYTQIKIDSNQVHDNGWFGISTSGPEAPAGSTVYPFNNVHVGNNNVYNNLGLSSVTNIHTGDGIVVGDTNTGTIEHNVAWNNGWKNASLTGGPCGIWAYDATGLIFQYNESYGNGTSAGKADGDGFDLDGGATNCIMQYNYSHDNYAAGFLIWEYGDTRTLNGNNTIRFNISQNDNTNNNFYAGITIGSDANAGVTANLIYNNTVYSKAGTCVNVNGGTNSRFYNNIFYAAQTGTPIITTATGSCFFLNNDYYNPGGFLVSINGTKLNTIASLRANANESLDGKDYGVDTDPQCNNAGNGTTIGTQNPSSLTNYQLNAGSPIIAAGLNLSAFGITMGASDFNGIDITSRSVFSIGACQSQ